MSLHRFFLTHELAATAAEVPVGLPLSADDLHHALAVLRLGVDDEIVAVGADSRAWVVRITRADPAGLEGIACRQLPSVRTSRVTLVQGLAKGDKLDLVVEKVTEIGVEAVLPVAFARSVVKLDAARAAKRGERLRRVALAAAKQSQRTCVPTVHDPITASGLPGHLAVFDLVLVAWEDASGDAPGIGDALAAADAPRDARIAIVVGPEGGLTTAEVDALVSAGAITVSLGATVLRTETAGILSAALCVYETGGLGGRLGD